MNCFRVSQLGIAPLFRTLGLRRSRHLLTELFLGVATLAKVAGKGGPVVSAELEHHEHAGAPEAREGAPMYSSAASKPVRLTSTRIAGRHAVPPSSVV